MIFHFCQMKAFFLLSINQIHHHSQPTEVHLSRFAPGQIWVAVEHVTGLLQNIRSNFQMEAKYILNSWPGNTTSWWWQSDVYGRLVLFYKILQIGMRTNRRKKIHFLYICSDLTYPIFNMTNPNITNSEMPNLNLKPHNTFSCWQLGLESI